MRGREKTRSKNHPLPQNKIHIQEVRPPKDRRGVGLISGQLPFGRLRYGERNAIENVVSTMPGVAVGHIVL
jgi:hypothetical protein